jgi:DNA polymerase (family X)
VEVIEELTFLVQTDDFAKLVESIRDMAVEQIFFKSTDKSALFALSSGPLLRVELADGQTWGLALIRCTGSKAHLRKLTALTGAFSSLDAPFSTEQSFYSRFGMAFVEPELREGLDEVRRGRKGNLPTLITQADIRGDLHAHTTASDGSNTIEQMATTAGERGYEYLGITDHSQSLKIAGGVPAETLWKQIRQIDELNGRLQEIRILKSAEVDILADGALDYPDDRSIG